MSFPPNHLEISSITNIRKKIEFVHKTNAKLCYHFVLEKKQAPF